MSLPTPSTEPPRHPGAASGRAQTGWRRWFQVDGADMDRMVRRLFLDVGDRGRNLSAFWILLILAAVIASAGVAADSTATVIGAMIVAPLMTPILGTALAVVLVDRRRLRQSMLLVICGALAVVVVGFLLGLVVPGDVVASTNSQVASRVNPRLIDLLGALATGLVGAFALIRSDVSDTLPGVAIAISLVPPLAVVGFTLEAGAVEQSAGALLLFGTNVTAIIFTGTVSMLLVDLRAAAQETGIGVGTLGARTVATVALSVIVVAVPLGIGSARVIQEQILISQATPVASTWADEQGWRVSEVTVRQGVLNVVALGLPPQASETALRSALDDAGLEDVDVSVTLVLGGTRDLPASSAAVVDETTPAISPG